MCTSVHMYKFRTLGHMYKCINAQVYTCLISKTYQCTSAASFPDPLDRLAVMYKCTSAKHSPEHLDKWQRLAVVDLLQEKQFPPEETVVKQVRCRGNLKKCHRLHGFTFRKKCKIMSKKIQLPSSSSNMMELRIL